MNIVRAKRKVDDAVDSYQQHRLELEPRSDSNSKSRIFLLLLGVLMVNTVVVVPVVFGKLRVTSSPQARVWVVHVMAD